MLYICVWITGKHASENKSICPYFLYAGENAFSDNLPSGLQNPCTYAQCYMGPKP